MPKKIDSKTKAAVVAALTAGETSRSVARRLGVSRPYISQVRAEVKSKPRRCPTCGAALTEAVVVDETSGATARLYAKETEPEPLYDETELLAGRFLGSVRVAISEKVERGAGVG